MVTVDDDYDNDDDNEQFIFYKFLTFFKYGEMLYDLIKKKVKTK